MKPLNSIEIMLCQKQAKMFEKSLTKIKYSSLIFIRRYMHSSIAKLIDDKVYLFTPKADSDVFSILDEEFGETTYGKTKYTQDQMF